MCSVTAVGIEELVDERLLQGDNKLFDWDTLGGPNKIPDIVAPTPGAASTQAEDLINAADKQGTAPCLPCTEIPLQDWADALRAVADLGDASILEPWQAEALKGRLRRLDIGCLMTVQAFQSHGQQRLGRELQLILGTDD